jgi:hypothetical protein
VGGSLSELLLDLGVGLDPPVTGVRRRSRDAVGWEGLKWVWVWVGFDDGCGERQPISIRSVVDGGGILRTKVWTTRS